MNVYRHRSSWVINPFTACRAFKQVCGMEKFYIHFGKHAEERPYGIVQQQNLLETVYCLPSYFSERTTMTGRQSCTWRSYIIPQFRDCLAGLWTFVVVQKSCTLWSSNWIVCQKKTPSKWKHENQVKTKLQAGQDKFSKSCKPLFWDTVILVHVQ